MAPTLDDLLNDGRLARLFSKHPRDCALQLWILQIKSEHSIENRVVYGRLLPYSHSNGRWFSSNDDNFHTFGHVQAQIIRINLYLESVYCEDLLRQLSAGRTLMEVSQYLSLEISNRQITKFGTTSLVVAGLIYRPVCYLLNRDAYEQRSLSSPHGNAGAFSASITQADKAALFRLGQDYDVALTDSVVQHLNADTGLDFGGIDAVRFGDLELLVFPALDDQERDLLSVSRVDTPSTLIARFHPMQVPYFNGFQFRLSIANGGQITYSGVSTAERDAEGIFECRFELNEQLHARIDSTELEIFGSHSTLSRESTLCCRWRIGYFREFHFQGHAVGQRASPVRFDWLEKTTRPAMSARVKGALTINRGNLGFTDHIGGREPDPWVPANRELASLFARLHPTKSEGRFFQRWSQGDGEGRLQFVEWFRQLLAKYQQHQLVIFDPYFDAAGLGLMLLCAATTTDYIVFRSLPKPIKEGKPLRRKSDKAAQEGVNNLLANCEQSRHLMTRIKLRIYGLKEGRLHDRYILVMGQDKLPVAGFNLSNSFQKAAENFPLLVTPIPADILLQVEQYKSGLVQEAEAIGAEGRTPNPSMQLLFDSSAPLTVPRHYEPLRFLEKPQAGNVLSIWTGESSLRGLSGGLLAGRMEALDLLKDGSLALTETADLRNCLKQQVGNFADFTSTWEVLGEVLAHSRTEDSVFRELESERGVLEFLVQFLNSSFNRVHDEVGKELAVIDSRLFRESIETLLHSSYRTHHLFHTTKYTALTWPEYFTIKLLWWFASDALLTIVEDQMANVPMEPQEPDVMRLSLLSQIISEIALSVQFDISETQRDRLVRSSKGLLQWIGLSAIDAQLEKPGGIATALQSVAAFTYPEQVRALGWMAHRAAGKPARADIFKGLVAALHEMLPAMIPANELRLLVNSMRGHMRQLAWAEPWLSQGVILPLLQSDRASADDAFDIWFQELAALLGPTQGHQSRLFEREREGQTTNITAFFFAHSRLERQQSSLKSMQEIVTRQRRIVQQPLASTSNWARWDDALVVLMWILAFTRWCQFYLRERGMTSLELEELSQSVYELAMVRPIGEWRSIGTGKQGELAAFVDQVDELLASSDVE